MSTHLMGTVNVGAAAREDRAAPLDRWLAALFRAAVSGGQSAGGTATGDLDKSDVVSGLALVATGGLGRRECAPSGDIDLLLLHDGGTDVESYVQRLWYPIWDAKIGLDHSVRTMPEALSVAIDDVRVALSLLDARHLAGDAAITASLRSAGLDQWRRTAGRALVRVRDAVAERVAAHGDLAFLLEGDLKESRGGLRDVQILRAISTLGITDAYRPAVRAAHIRLLDVRDTIHAAAGRRVDRILAQDRDAIAAALGLRDGDALLRRVSTDARTVAYALDDAWRAVDRWRAAPSRTHKPSRLPLARDVIAYDGEAVLARTAIGPAPDPSLALRVAAAAATAGLPIARATLDWLARFAPPLPTPWSDEARRAFVTLLGSGDMLVATWEGCDRAGLVGSWLPAWNRLRGLPQHHPIHVYTVDRHSVQAVAWARQYVREVSRPDLLLVATLLHDVGKGLDGDHSEVGAPIAAQIATQLGFDPSDVDTIARVVRLHLLLPNIATRRDITDPVTIRQVASAVGDPDTLDLLHALCRADAAAAGPTATSPWKTRLVGRLAGHVRAMLTGGPLPAPARVDAPLAGAVLPAVDVREDEVTVAARDRRGLLAAVAGVLALHRLDVVGADTWTDDDRAVVRFAVSARFGQAADQRRLAAELRLAALGELPADRLARLESLRRVVPGRGSPRSTVTEPTVTWHADDATDAVVLELRASDAPGLLYRVTGALAGAGADVRAARVATLGGDVVDAFYLGGAWDSARHRQRIVDAVLDAAA